MAASHTQTQRDLTPTSVRRPLVRWAAPIALAAAVMLTAACSDSDTVTTDAASAVSDGESTTTVENAGDDTTTTGSIDTGDELEPVGPLGLDTVTSPGFLTVAQPTALLVGVETGRHQGFIRVVFTFDGPEPNFEVGYIQPPMVQQGSGMPIAIAGDTVLQVITEPAAAVDIEDPALAPTYTGPTTIALGPPGPVTELVFGGDFEAIAQWGIGLDGRRPFAVTTLANPSRLVVDIADTPAP